MSASYRIEDWASWSVFGSDTGRGVGGEAQTLQSLACKIRQRFYETISLGKAQQEALDDLDSVFSECAQPNWDGYNGLAVSYESYLNAKKFIEALPTNLPVPSISAEPDGEISFEWYSAPRLRFSVSVGPNNNLTYAGLFAANRAHGTETFHGEIPGTILNNLRRVRA